MGYIITHLYAHVRDNFRQYRFTIYAGRFATLNLLRMTNNQRYHIH